MSVQAPSVAAQVLWCQYVIWGGGFKICPHMLNIFTAAFDGSAILFYKNRVLLMGNLETMSDSVSLVLSLKVMESREQLGVVSLNGVPVRKPNPGIAVIFFR